MNGRLILGLCTVATLAVSGLALSRADDSAAHGDLMLHASAVDGAARYQVQQISCDGGQAGGFAVEVDATAGIDQTISVPVGCYRVDLIPQGNACQPTRAIDVPVSQALATSVTLFADCEGLTDII